MLLCRICIFLKNNKKSQSDPSLCSWVCGRAKICRSVCQEDSVKSILFFHFIIITQFTNSAKYSFSCLTCACIENKRLTRGGFFLYMHLFLFVKMKILIRSKINIFTVYTACIFVSRLRHHFHLHCYWSVEKKSFECVRFIPFLCVVYFLREQETFFVSTWFSFLLVGMRA